MKQKVTVRIPRLEVFTKVARANGLRGKQRITSLMYEHGYGDAFAFDSNATGGWGEKMTFHYETDEMLMQSLGFNAEESKSGKIHTEPCGYRDCVFVVEYEKEIAE